MLYFECTLPFAIHIHDGNGLNGFGIKRLRILNTFDNIKGNIIIF